jgi:hypothetical protein
MKASHSQSLQSRGRHQGGWALPLMLVLGAILLLLSTGLYFILSKELKMNAVSVTADHTFSGGDAALNRAATWLESHWGNYGEANGGSGYDSLTTTPYSDIPGIMYNISVSAGALAITYTTSAYVPTSQWQNTGDYAYDRTIFVKVTDLSSTNNANATKYYYTTLHRDSLCRPLFADPLLAMGNISMGGLDQGSCYTLAQLSSGSTATSCLPVHQVAGGAVTTPVSCYTPVNGYPVCTFAIPTPVIACPLPGFVNLTDNFFFPTPTYTPFQSPTPNGSYTNTFTSTYTPTVTPTNPAFNPPSICYAVFTTCGNVMIDGGTNSYNPSTGVVGGGNGNVSSGSTITVNGGGLISGTAQANSPAPGCPSVPTPYPTPAGMTSKSGSNMNVNSGVTITYTAGTYAGCGNMNNGGTVYLPAGNYVFDGINNNSGNTIWTGPGVVQIWIIGGWNNSGLIKPISGNSSDLWIYLLSSATVNDNSSGVLYGFLYGPGATLNVDETIYGGVVADSVTINGGAHVYYPYQGGACYSAGTPAPSATPTSVYSSTFTITATTIPTSTVTPCSPGYLNLTSTTKAVYLGAATGNQPYYYQCNNMDLGTGAMYVDLRGGPVTLYVSGNLTCTASANPSIYMFASPMLNLTGTAQANPPNIFTVVVYGNLVMLSSVGTYNMALAAPNAAVIFYPGTGAGPGVFNGAIMASSIANTGGAITFNYPLDLVGRANAYWEPPLVLQGWRKYLGP